MLKKLKEADLPNPGYYILPSLLAFASLQEGEDGLRASKYERLITENIPEGFNAGHSYLKENFDLYNNIDFEAVSSFVSPVSEMFGSLFSIPAVSFVAKGALLVLAVHAAASMHRNMNRAPGKAADFLSKRFGPKNGS